MRPLPSQKRRQDLADLTEYMVDHVYPQGTLYLDRDDYELFVQALDAPPKVLPALAKLLKEYPDPWKRSIEIITVPVGGYEVRERTEKVMGTYDTYENAWHAASELKARG